MGNYFSYQHINTNELNIQKTKFNRYDNVLTEYKTKYLNEQYYKSLSKPPLFKPTLETIDEENI